MEALFISSLSKMISSSIFHSTAFIIFQNKWCGYISPHSMKKKFLMIINFHSFSRWESVCVVFPNNYLIISMLLNLYGVDFNIFFNFSLKINSRIVLEMSENLILWFYKDMIFKSINALCYSSILLKRNIFSFTNFKKNSFGAISLKNAKIIARWHSY